MKVNYPIILTAMLCLLNIDVLHSQTKLSKLKPTLKETQAIDTVKKVSVKENIKSSRKIPGLFTLYQDTITGSVQIYIFKKQIGLEFIYQSFSMGGPPELFLNQNMIRETWVFNLRKTFDKIEWTKSNTNYYYDSTNAISKSANVDISEAAFFSEKIIAKDSTGYLISGDGLFLSEKLDPIRPFILPSVPPETYLNLGTLNKDKSSYNKIRSFPKNTDVLVSLSYENPKPVNFGGRDITDARYIKVKMQHTFLELPVNDFVPRMDDHRVGYFSQEIDNMTTTEVPRYRDFINRWHLTKKDSNASISEPLEPIVWWVENTTPVELRDNIVEAGLKWNKAFEKAGFKNAVVMKIMSDTSTWDPADVRYNVIRWVSSDLGYAIGPSFVNPRTGQILGADITIDFGLFAGITSVSDLYETFSKLPEHKNYKTCTLGRGLKMQQAAAVAVIEALNAPDDELLLLTKQFMTFLILHEMGHTMGLNHNMKASQMLSPGELTNKEITQKLGVTGSVMDYPIANVAFDRSKQGDYYTTKTGPYDAWAIEYGYTPFNKAEEKDGLAKILSRSTDPNLIFGNDADITFPGRGIDPRVSVWDMSNDLLTYAEDRFRLVNDLMPLLKKRFVKPGKSYEGLLNKYNALLGQRYGMAASASHYIGGILVDRSLPEQQSGNNPLTPVPSDYQKRAMSLLGKYVFSPNAFAGDAQLFSYLQRQRRGFHFWDETEDPKLDVHIYNLQATVLDFILHPVTLRRINNTTLYGNTYEVSNVMSDLLSNIFDEDINSDVNLYRQNIQTDLIQRLGAIVNDPKKQFDNSSVAAAYYSLTKIKVKLKKAKSRDEQTKAHRSYLLFQIEKQLSTTKQ